MVFIFSCIVIFKYLSILELYILKKIYILYYERDFCIRYSKISVFDFFRDVLSILCRLGCIIKFRKEVDVR